MAGLITDTGVVYQVTVTGKPFKYRVYVLVKKDGTLAGIVLPGDYMDITDKLSPEDREKGFNKAIGILHNSGVRFQ